ncbi:hypothetical protein DB35_09530 [Streptomyces abyssalis]|uniref:DUF2637 domain-containing protein n=1 Tax=Streptomyces abyssalis TaxID=933944 RepID=UPI00085C04CB|nr:DUF2637 domain-containing protein [Streptomyces abyssalis]OEU92337.1 hypothetical protein DB35_09530 [Streptomyces abyssalis]OEV29385.1 hypothetical protein AN219_16725 [Streptomyces nanshensis]
MTVTDLPAAGVVAGAVLLAGAVAAVVLMTRGRRAAKRADGGDGWPADSWEQMEQRRRRKETVYATAAYLLLFCCAAVAAALSFHGLVGFGRQNLRLSGGWEYLVPFGLDGAAMFSAVIAVREASHGDASLGSRLLVWAFAGAAAWFNWVHAPRGDGHAGAPEFFAGMSLSAAILFDRALKQTRRAALREQGLVPRPLPQIRVVRWLRAPRETFRAWSLMLLEGVRTLDQAVEEVRDERRRDEQERLRRKEQQKLDRARVKALGRQHRGRGARGRGKDVAGGAELPAVAPPAQVTGSAGGAGSPSVPVAPLPAQHGSAGGRGEARGEDAGAGTAGPRLDSLEEKLAEIERQFG